MGAAVLTAAQDARNQILTIASDMLEASPSDLEIEEDKVVVRGSPGKSVLLKDIASASMRFAGKYEPIYGRGRSALRTSAHLYTVHVAKVAVDPTTGEVRVLDYLAVQDVGFAINPAEVDGQIYGGVTPGVGWGAFLRISFYDDWQAHTSNLQDYALPHYADNSHITSTLVGGPTAPRPFRA